jgi:hypothetical protein
MCVYLEMNLAQGVRDHQVPALCGCLKGCIKGNPTYKVHVFVRPVGKNFKSLTFLFLGLSGT